MGEPTAGPGAGEERPAKTFIGGRHGSPTISVALPFSSITTTDGALRDAVADLAGLVAELARHVSADDRAAVERVAGLAAELAEGLREH
jgi:hypothetical protein